MNGSKNVLKTTNYYNKMINHNIMHYLYEYLTKSFITTENQKLIYTYDMYNPFKPYQSYRQSENVNKFLIQKISEIDKRLTQIEAKINEDFKK